MKLTYLNNTRLETDPFVINNLLRKGWVEQSDPPDEIPDEEIEKNIKDQMQKDLLRSNIADLIDKGFSVEPENFILGMQESDRNAFSQMLGLVKEALDLGLIDSETPQTISDKSGQKHQLTTLRFRQVMVQYGFYFKTLWDQLES